MFAKSSIQLLAGRIVIAAIIYLGLLGLASQLNPSSFGDISYTIFLMKSLALCGLGASQGFIYYSMRSDVTKYVKSYICLLSIASLIYTLLLVYFFNVGEVEMFLVMFFLVLLEPYLKTNGNFYAVLYPELVLVLTYCSAAYFEFTSRVHIFILCLMFSMLLLSMSFSLIKRFVSLNSNSFFDREYVFALIRTGAPMLLFNLSFFAFLLIDRYFISMNHTPAELGVIMLAYQFALASGFIVISLNSKAIVDIGLLWQRNDIQIRSVILTKLKKLLLLSLFSIFCVAAVVYFSQGLLFERYEDLLYYFFVISFGLMFFNLYSAVAPVLFYLKRQVVPVLAILLSAMFLLVVHLLSFRLGISLKEIELMNYLVFSVVMVALILHAFNMVRKRDLLFFVE